MSRKKGNHGVIAVLVVILLFIIVVAAGLMTTLIKRHTPSDVKMDLNKYYSLAKEDEAALVLQNQVSEHKGKVIEGVFYLDYETITEALGGRFYWDTESGKMLYVKPTEILAIAPDSTTYVEGGETKEENYKIIRLEDDNIYIALDFAQKYMKITSTVSEEPYKAVIRFQWKPEDVVKVKKDTQIRYQGGVKSEILTEVSSGTELVLLEELENWSKVSSPDGFIGYIEKDKISGPKVTEREYTGSYEEEYTHVTRDHKINLAWHQVTSEDANKGLENTLKTVSGINVISPTWFSVVATEGNISSLASKEYVDLAHSKGLEVWGLIDNFNKSVSTLETLSVGSARAHLISMLMQEAERVGLDGINVDFEMITEEEAPHFVQFVRELSIACRQKGLVLSVDNPVPMFTRFYNRKEQGIMADYIIIMGYDENIDGVEQAGSVASLPFVEEGILHTLEEVPADRVINGVPFYTRFWFTENTGAVSSEIMGMDQASQAVKDMQMNVYWDEEAGQNYAEFKADKGTYQMWIEDEQSLDAKMQLVSKYELGGSAAWKLGFERSDVWEIISNHLK